MHSIFVFCCTSSVYAASESSNILTKKVTCVRRAQAAEIIYNDHEDGMDKEQIKQDLNKKFEGLGIHPEGIKLTSDVPLSEITSLPRFENKVNRNDVRLSYINNLITDCDQSN